MKLKDKVAVITGAGSGIGRASAELFAREGAKVVVADINEEGGEKTVSSIAASGGDAVFVKCDVSNEIDIKAMIEAVVKKYGRIDILFNVAGRTRFPEMIEELTVEDWDGMINTNLRSIWLTAKYAVGELRKTGGRLINVGSLGGLSPRPGTSIYAASKGAVVALTKALAIEFAPEVRVNVINPGPVDTPMLPYFDRQYDETMKKGIIEGTPLKRIVEPEDVAYAGLYLASDDSVAITGTMLNVDSGLSIGGRGKK